MQIVHVEVRDATCKNPTCTICIQTCFYDALRQAEDSTVGELYHNCIGCELCTQTCPFDSIHMYANPAEQQASGKFYQIPGPVFESGKFETGFDRGISLARVKD